ncbi:transcription antitermination protein NusB [Pontibacillus halophilus JSM 076056 = DSM 19796]|uniref:Transcription antitermination protein NusB n=1 Tax=Pontibacillus halophilus JSM 076056 = DSM 19796 TaxID=1385510 RepID=A0A0A5GIE8_9BACI|nr:transcription antitermination factor NusB [Pontibacillus halophilus]KGX90910.1 transcription antitermination protein NusB [Pontibacillus halophilus JSM 076056 = DSM 19796]
MKRRTAREKAFQALFQMDINDIPPRESIANVLEEGIMTDKFLETIVFGVTEHKESIDEQIQQHLEKWTIKRVASVEKTLLRMATFEMGYVEDVPNKVALNEAIELAKVFGDDQSGRFINGVLKKVLDSYEQ